MVTAQQIIVKARSAERHEVDLISAMLIDPSIVPKLSAFRGDDFTAYGTGPVFEILRRNHRDGEDWNLKTIRDELAILLGEFQTSFKPPMECSSDPIRQVWVVSNSAALLATWIVRGQNGTFARYWRHFAAQVARASISRQLATEVDESSLSIEQILDSRRQQHESLIAAANRLGVTA